MAEEAEVKIKLKADDSQAVGAIKRVQGAFATAARGIGAFTRALGVVGFAIQGIQALVGAFKTLHAWMTRGKDAAAQMRRELEQARYERGVEAAAKAYRELNAEIERTIRLEKERAAIQDRATAKRRDAEDARLELAKQGELAALDPAAEGYAARKEEIEDRYARKGAELTAARAREDAGADAARLREELGARERQIAGQKASREKDLADAGAAREEIDRRVKGRAWLDAMGPLGGKQREENEARIEELRKREKAALDSAAEKAAAIRAAEEVAETVRQAVAAATEGDGAAMRADAAGLALDRRARERAAEEKRAAEKREKEEAQEEEAREKKERRLAKERELAELDYGDAGYETKRKAIERKYAYLDAGDDEAARLAVDNEIIAEAAEEERAARTARAGEMEGFADRLAAFEGVSGNRLTAMGLGSGVDGKSAVAADVKKIVELLKEEIAATRESKSDHHAQAAVLGE